MNAPVVRSALPVDEAAWKQLWAGYCRDLGFTADPDGTRRTWTRILDPDSAIMCVVAEIDGQVYGMAHCVVHEHTRETQAVCCLQDLYVVPSARGRGIASALIEWLCNAMRAEGWAQLYWVAQQGNELAHQLSRRFAEPDPLSRYAIRPR